MLVHLVQQSGFRLMTEPFKIVDLRTIKKERRVGVLRIHQGAIAQEIARLERLSAKIDRRIENMGNHVNGQRRVPLGFDLANGDK